MHPHHNPSNTLSRPQNKRSYIQVTSIHTNTNQVTLEELGKLNAYLLTELEAFNTKPSPSSKLTNQTKDYKEDYNLEDHPDVWLILDSI